MKKYTIRLLTFCAISTMVLTTSCEKQLYLDPISDISDGIFYNTAEDIDLAVIAVYNSMYEVMFDEFAVTELRSDNTYMSPQASVDNNRNYRDLDRFVLTSQNLLVQTHWRALYRTINLANLVIANIDVVEDADLAAQYEAEAKFFRAHAYLKLVRLWGGVFIVEEPLTGQEAKTKTRATVAEVYAFLVSDLEYASENLPEVADGTSLGRVTKWAAQTELGLALLTRNEGSDNADAVTVLREVVNMSGFSLLSSYADVFDISNEYNNEILFAVRYQSGSVGLGAPFANFFAPNASDNLVVTGSGDELNVPTTDLSVTYESDDLRKTVNLADSFLQNGVYSYDRYIKKYNSSFNTVDDAGNDWPIIRFADAMLLLAEALNNQGGPSTEAIDLLNQVHTRAGLPAISSGDVASFFDFKLALEEERRLEFAFENHRWFDLVRTERAVTVMNNHFATADQYNDPDTPGLATSPISTNRLLLPIPQYEIDLNPTVAQNIGY